jgi:hypothetical protein
VKRAHHRRDDLVGGDVEQETYSPEIDREYSCIVRVGQSSGPQERSVATKADDQGIWRHRATLVKVEQERRRLDAQFAQAQYRFVREFERVGAITEGRKKDVGHVLPRG